MVTTRLRVVTSRGLPAGWTGKLWAMKQGIDAAEAPPQPPDYLLFTDADIMHASDSVTRLVVHAERGGLALASLMVKLRCESFAERANIPAFIFFFQMLYPFSWVNRPRSEVAAAAGGCMLVRAGVLRKVGGIEVIRGALIDDCALAKALKLLRTDLARIDRARAQRPSLPGIRRYPPHGGALGLCTAGLFAASSVGHRGGDGADLSRSSCAGDFRRRDSRMIGIATWALMAVAFQPTLRFYRLSPLWGIALPAIALQYMLFTLDSAYQYVRGRGGSWKGRVQANLSDS